MHDQKNSLTSLSDIIKKLCSQGRNPFYLEDLVNEANIPLNQVEDLLVQLLKKDELEAKVEVKCPRCGRDQGEYERLSQIPEELSCDICQYEFPKQVEDFQIVLEVKESFFRKAHKVSVVQIVETPTKRELHALLDSSMKERSRSKKGWIFEGFFEKLMITEKNFELKFKHPRSKTGEIDYVYHHNIEMGRSFWGLSPYICIECKNWKDNISSVEIGHLVDLVREKGPLSCCGVYLTSSSYDPSATERIKTARVMDRILIIAVDGKNLKGLVDCGFRNFVEDLCEEQVFKDKFNKASSRN